MKNVLFAALAGVFAIVVTLIAAEGIYSISNGGKPQNSLSYEALSLAGLITPPKPKNLDGYAPYVSDVAQIDETIDPLIQNGVVLGNSPYEKFVTAGDTVNTVGADGCYEPRPNLRKNVSFLRSPLFNPLNQISVFYDADKKLDDRVQAFLDRYATPPAITTTNAQGERVTIPVVEQGRKVVIAGDSVAFGAMIADAETLASQLQSRDLQRQYVNLGTPGADARDILCRLESAARRYAGELDELIYVYCENDFDRSVPYGKPQEVIDWLVEFAAREKIAKVTVVYAPYIYSIAPEVTRFAGYSRGAFRSRMRQRGDLLKAVEAAGLGWIDIGTLAREEQVRRRSPFGFFSMFVDHIHLSGEGVTVVVDQLAAR
jgi:hypothetical protein